jgi:hypothetical protein
MGLDDRAWFVGDLFRLFGSPTCWGVREWSRANVESCCSASVFLSWLSSVQRVRAAEDPSLRAGGSSLVSFLSSLLMFPLACCVSTVSSAREVAGLSSCFAFVARSGGSASECAPAFASSDTLLVARGIWGLASFCDCWRLLLRAGELPERPRRALLERDIGASSSCVDADMLYLTAQLVSSLVCATACDIFDCIARISSLSPSLLYMILVRVTAFVQGL